MFITKVNRVITIFLVMVLLVTFINPFPASACLEKQAEEAWNLVEKDFKFMEEKLAEKNEKKLKLVETVKELAVAGAWAALAILQGNKVVIAAAILAFEHAKRKNSQAQEEYDAAEALVSFAEKNYKFSLAYYKAIERELKPSNKKSPISNKIFPP